MNDMNIYIYIYIYIHTHTNTFRVELRKLKAEEGYMYVCMYVCIRIVKRRNIHIYIHTHTYMHTFRVGLWKFKLEEGYSPANAMCEHSYKYLRDLLLMWALRIHVYTYCHDTCMHRYYYVCICNMRTLIQVPEGSASKVSTWT